ncbi:hypothetical protein KMW28_16340 [Flammeovirga yaeyamensis]|uniref:Alginate export domain-containing protein n=1 Tax=Flammeovirga yaeyamensis TaxID=367791 RepID=A0AAX1N0V7_9BACT|nr:hypothetical protein [Flammeovirga yaeyamensis]MBB3698420.1 hypothetical protein [Flammeovirga yaeyamensis]NMF34230.1 hypothetical protein [Flammeovirga yaeyamensis]QWG01214.1 hypothetical protein KMW28_16340 [Flammeovirga yaeyamensis]
MRQHQYYYIFLFFLFISFTSIAQEEEEEKTSKFKENFVADGYLKYMQTIAVQKDYTEEWFIDNLIHNRLNFKYYAGDKWTFGLSGRNRLIYGASPKMIPEYAKQFGNQDQYAFNMSYDWITGKSFVLNSEIDRAYADYSTGNWQFRVGRQRINWGVSMVWNPNDLFNTYSFFDFDYEERPGADAILIRNYIGATSSIEVVFSPSNQFDYYNIAGLYKFNVWQYDFQVLGGYVRENYHAGAGWEGQIGGAGFKGEATYFIPDYAGEDASVVADISLDYTFKNSLYLHTETIYNSNGATGKIGALDPNLELTPKTLSLSKFAFFNEAQYQITPLTRLGVNSIINSNDLSYYIGGNVTTSFSDNFELLVFGMFFFGDEDSLYGQGGSQINWRLKWSF